MIPEDLPDADAEAPMSSFMRHLRREDVRTLAALAVLTLLAWLSFPHVGPSMPEGKGAMADMALSPMPWTALRVGLTFAMWAVMMVAMMLPSAVPIVLLHRRLSMHYKDAADKPAPTSLIVLGYVAVWAVFSVGATLCQLLLSEALLLTPMDSLADRTLAGGVLIAAGLYQLTPLKQTCLHFCRSPTAFLMRHYRPGVRGALLMGVHHGLYCLGCCWAAMALLFVGGVMNLAWVVGLAAFVLIEKLLPFGRMAGLVLGAAAVLAGLYLIADAQLGLSGGH